MLPPSKSPFDNDAAASHGNRERCDTGGSAKSALSLDLFDFLQRSEEFQMGALTSDGATVPLRSAEFVEGMILRETAAMDAASGKAEQPTAPSDGKPQPKLERDVAGDDIALLNMSLLNMSFRISSGNWIADYEAEESVNSLATTMRPSLFTGDPKTAAEFEKSSSAPPPVSLLGGYKDYQMPLQSTGHQAARMLLRLSSRDWVTDFKDECASSEPVSPGLFTEFMDDASTDDTTAQCSAPPLPLKSPTDYDGEHHISLTPPPRQSELISPLPITLESLRVVSPGAVQATMSQSRMTTPEYNRKKKQRARQLNETSVVEPAENDVLCGRGGFTNSHPGNIRFRKKALEFRSWYEQSSKEEKHRIAELLVESITSEGHRFLGKGKDGSWHEMVQGAHRKASQALRERIKRGSQ